MFQNVHTSDNENSDVIIDESFEEILSDYEIVNEDSERKVIETEPLCGSCLAPVDADEEQDIAYCEKCQTTVFVERRNIV